MKDQRDPARPERPLLMLTQLLGKRDTKIVVLIGIGILIGTLIDPSIMF